MIYKGNDRDWLVIQDLKNGLTWNEIQRKHKVSATTIKKIIKQGTYYFDAETGNIIFSAKNIKLEEQVFHYLNYLDSISNGGFFQQQSNSLISRRAINPRLAAFLNVNRSQTQRWSKKPQKLFECDSYGNVEVRVSQSYNSFMLKEVETFAKNAYYVDEYNRLKGYKLWYVYVSQKWLYHLRPYIFEFVAWRLDNGQPKVSDFFTMLKEKNIKDDYWYINAQVAMEYGEWVMNKLDVYTYEQIKQAIDITVKDIRERTIEENNYLEYIDIDLPTVFYIEKRAYYSNILTKEQKAMVEKYLVK